MLREYDPDFRSVRTGHAPFGLVHAEVGWQVGLVREIGTPTGPSPHARRRLALPGA